MKKQSYILLSLVVAAIAVLLFMNFKSGQPNKAENGFSRKFLSDQPEKLWQQYLPPTIDRLCGSKRDTIYLGTPTPGLIYILTGTNHHFDSVRLPIEPMANLSPVFTTVVEYPTIYIFGENAKCLIKGNLISGQYSTTYLHTGPFKSPHLIDSGHVVLSAIDTTTYDAVIRKVDLATNQIQDGDGLLPKLGDAGFTNDGMLAYDKATGLFLYTCFYSNKIIGFDSQLKLVYAAHTIDTFATSNLKIKKTAVAITNASPPRVINRYSVAHNKLLFVSSNVKANNQTEADFAAVENIDVYTTSPHSYLTTIKIPLQNGKRMGSFVVTDNALIGLYDNLLMSYAINLNNPNLLLQ